MTDAAALRALVVVCEGDAARPHARVVVDDDPASPSQMLAGGEPWREHEIATSTLVLHHLRGPDTPLRGRHRYACPACRRVVVATADKLLPTLDRFATAGVLTVTLSQLEYSLRR